MNTEFFDLPEKDKQQEAAGKEKTNTAQEEAQISHPNIDRPEGPFEHSGEVSHWTKEEEAEKKDQGKQ